MEELQQRLQYFQLPVDSSKCFFPPESFFLFSMDLVLTVFLWTSATALMLSSVFQQFFHKFYFTDLIIPWNFSALILGLECFPPSRVYRNHWASKCDCSNVACRKSVAFCPIGKNILPNLEQTPHLSMKCQILMILLVLGIRLIDFLYIWSTSKIKVLV